MLTKKNTQPCSDNKNPLAEPSARRRPLIRALPQRKFRPAYMHGWCRGKVGEENLLYSTCSSSYSQKLSVLLKVSKASDNGRYQGLDLSHLHKTLKGGKHPHSDKSLVSYLHRIKLGKDLLSISGKTKVAEAKVSEALRELAEEAAAAGTN